MAKLFVLGKIDLLNLIFFSFIIGNFCCWTNFFGFVYFVLDFRSIIFIFYFFMVFKMRKMLELQIFLHITDVMSGY